MQSKYFKKISIISIVVITLVASFIITGCQREEDEPLDDIILNSSELEEYIIAGADLKQSLAIFTEELNKIDFSALEVTYDVEGRKVMYLPMSVSSISIEAKLQTFNETKEALRKKFPHFSSLREDMHEKYFQQCVKSSVNISSKFLELGINITQPKLKNGTEGITYWGSWTDVMYELLMWVQNPNYVEMVIMTFADGKLITYINPKNTTNKAHVSIGTQNGYHYFEGYQSSPLTSFTHTHRDSADPGTADNTFKETYPNMSHSIYYQEGFYYY
ncbi:MAG: hypothetical protein LBQ60_13575 [Bacteroidales bacterium]|nr:hypothetical protein [Bacteroidales bacterium]